jgi:hypothetical protein
MRIKKGSLYILTEAPRSSPLIFKAPHKAPHIYSGLIYIILYKKE